MVSNELSEDEVKFIDLDGLEDLDAYQVSSVCIEKYEEKKDNFYSMSYICYHLLSKTADEKH